MTPASGGDRGAAIKRIVLAAYEDPNIVSRYLELGLWPAEENLILDFVVDEGTILDIGCGAGRTTIPLAEMGLKVVGVDLSQAMVDAAREQAADAGVEVEFSVMDAMALDFPEAHFDAVLFSYNGIELIPGSAGKRSVFEEIHRVLKPRGRFIFCSHSPFALNRFALMRLRAFLRFLAGKLLGVPVREREIGERFVDDEWEEARYLQVLPPSTLIRLLRAAGLELIYFNTRGRIESARKWGGWRGHLEDGERFYVAEKSVETAL